jgi:hypothetical protein
LHVPAREGRESARLVLEFAQAREVLDALGGRLDVPNIIVAEDRSPASCTLRCTSSQRSVLVFFGAMILRTRSTRISAPAPGTLPRPADFRSAITASTGRLSSFAR